MSDHTLAARLEITIAIAEEAGQMIIKAREQQDFAQRLKKRQ